MSADLSWSGHLRSWVVIEFNGSFFNTGLYEPLAYLFDQRTALNVAVHVFCFEAVSLDISWIFA